MAGIAVNISKDRAKVQGLGTPDNPVKYLGQDFETLKAECLRKGILFVDPKFPPNEDSIGPALKHQVNFVWKRPKQIHRNPQFIIDGATREDIVQGSLGNCWFLASIASLTQNKDFLPIVLHGNQSFKYNYAGIFHFKIWQYGEWVDVVVDDYLPTISESGELLSVRSLNENEFWGALLEKAYAKLHLCYEGMDGGVPVEGLQDLTGGTSELYIMKKKPKDLFQIIQKRISGDALLTCSSRLTSSESNPNKDAEQGLIIAHAYSIIGAYEFNAGRDNVKLIKLRNPWGNTEWTGAWSDDSPEWRMLRPSVRDKLTVNRNDGEFWMSFPDFLEQFSRVEVCNINLSNALKKEAKRWNEILFSGSWRSGFSAGGPKDKESFWTNPQFWLKLDKPDDDRRGSSTEPCCTVILSLMQKDRRKLTESKQKMLGIGFCVYKIPAELCKAKPIQLDKEFFRKYQPVAQQECKGYRDVSSCLKLPVGTYLIVPHAHIPNTDNDLCLRVFSEKKPGAFGGIGVGIDPTLKEINLTNQSGDTRSAVDYTNITKKKQELDVDNLKVILDKILTQRTDIRSDGFSASTCREMINLFDINRTGTVDVEEFKDLWENLETYMGIFKTMDADSSGSMDSNEMRNALCKAGFELGNNIQEVIVQKYASSDLTIKFDDFIACLIRLKTLFKMFNLLDTTKSEFITLSLSEWLCVLLA
uniref:Uncharacterized protein n=1 Tax=Leptobrachium leishanense TaxID=445787 RepID=A0A8C5M379_9ANUR